MSEKFEAIDAKELPSALASSKMLWLATDDGRGPTPHSIILPIETFNLLLRCVEKLAENGPFIRPDLVQKYLRLMEEANSRDIEKAHIQADAVLCDLLTELGYSPIVEAWDVIPKWYTYGETPHQRAKTAYNI